MPPRKKTETTEQQPTVVADTPPQGSTELVAVSEHRDFTYSEPPAALSSRIQLGLGEHKLYTGPSNGVWTKDAAKALQSFLSSYAYSGSIDGNLDTQKSVVAIQEFAKNQGGYSGTIDSRLTDVVWSAFVVGLEKEIA